jgi:hypothetical protein
MNGAIAQWVADTDQASRAACEWSKGGAKKWFEDMKTLCSICAKWNEGFFVNFTSYKKHGVELSNTRLPL